MPRDKYVWIAVKVNITKTEINMSECVYTPFKKKSFKHNQISNSLISCLELSVLL